MQCKFNSVFTYLQCIINRTGLELQFNFFSGFFMWTCVGARIFLCLLGMCVWSHFEIPAEVVGTKKWLVCELFSKSYNKIV